MVIYKKIHHEKDPVIHKSGFPWFMSCQGFFCCVWAHVCNKPNSLIWLSQNCPILRNFCPPIDTEKLLETSFAGSLQGLNRKSLVYKKEKTKELTNSEDLGWVDFRVFFFLWLGVFLVMSKSAAIGWSFSIPNGHEQRVATSCGLSTNFQLTKDIVTHRLRSQSYLNRFLVAVVCNF